MSREFWIGLVVGLLIGWLIEWVIDWSYWRKKYDSIVDQLDDAKDNLKDINGIGKVIEKRLNHAGIFTFKKLSQKTRVDIEKIIGKAQNLADEQEIIDQAKKLAKKLAKKKGK